MLACMLLSSSIVSILQSEIVSAEESAPEQLAEDWWDSSWIFRKKITIDNPISGYQMELTVWKENEHDSIVNNEIDCEGKCNDDFSDLRFIDEYNNKLPHWIAFAGTSNSDHYATLWINTSGSNYIYMYYGNIDAETEMSGDDVWFWYDDFNDGEISGWSYSYSENSQGGVSESGGLIDIWANGNDVIGWRYARLYSQKKFSIGTKLIARISSNYDWRKSWEKSFGFGESNGAYLYRSESTAQWRCGNDNVTAISYLGTLDSLTNIEIHRVSSTTGIFKSQGETNQYITSNIPTQDCGIFATVRDCAGADTMHLYLDYIAVGKTSEIEPTWNKFEVEEEYQINLIPPNADFEVSPTTQYVNEFINFFDTSIDDDGAIVSWTWYIDDVEFAYTQNAVYEFNDEGDYNVKLIVEDNDGKTDDISKQITVTNPSFSVEDDIFISVDAGYDIITYENQITNFEAIGNYIDGEIVSYEWDFENDGVIDLVTDQPFSSYTYENLGLYELKIIAYDEDRNSGFDIINVDVRQGSGVQEYIPEIESVPPLSISENLGVADGIRTIYSILIGGISEPAWNPVKQFYNLLISNDANDSDIFVLLYNGGSPPDKTEIVDGKATTENLENAITHIGSKIDEDDLFFFLGETHGTGYNKYLADSWRNRALYGFHYRAPVISTPGDEYDYLESDVQLSLLCANGGSIYGQDMHYGLGEWGVKWSPGSHKMRLVRYTALSHFSDIYVEGKGNLSDDDIYIERFTDYAIGDFNKDGYISFENGEIEDWDGDGILPFNRKTGEFDEDDWGPIDVFENNFERWHSRLGKISFKVFDANLDNHLDIDLNPTGNFEIDGTDLDNNGVIDGLDINEDGDFDDWLTTDEEMCLYGTRITDDKFRSYMDWINYGKKAYAINTCYSGGFIYDLSSNNSITITGSREYCSASMGFMPTWLCKGFKASSIDTDNDGKISFLDAFNYASVHPGMGCSNDMDRFQYDDNNDHISHEDPLPNGGDGELGSNTYFFIQSFKPVPKFNYDIIGQNVNFDSSESYDLDGQIVSYNWSFGDGYYSNNQNPSHLYQVSGTYNVCLTVEDNKGLINSISKNLEIISDDPENIPPSAEFSYFVNDLTVEFYDNSFDPDGSIVSCSWTFGDGQTSNEQNPSHTYSISGTYVVILTVTDNLGDSDSKTQSVSVDDNSIQMVYVDDNFNENTPGWGIDHFDNIKDGINAVEDKGTVYVYSGTYYEHDIQINKKINLIGEDRDAVIVDGGGNKDVIYISVNGVTISNLTIQNSGSDTSWPGDHNAGIDVHSSNNLITDCKISNNGGSGVFIRSSFNKIINCYLSKNKFNIDSFSCSNNIIKNCEIFKGRSGVHLWRSTDNQITGCNISSCSWDGIWLSVESHHNEISDCDISNCESGIMLSHDCGNNLIKNSNISNNAYRGIELWNPSCDNVVYHNTFINNPNSNAFDDFTNVWDNGYPSGGNHWDDFDEPSEGAYDNNSDGIADSPYPYIKGGNNQDRYPLMGPQDDENDSDYEGCSHGFWKNHKNEWVGYTTDNVVEDVFDLPEKLNVLNVTLIEALKFSGGNDINGSAKILLVQAVAGVLNAAHPYVNYPLSTYEVITQVNDALSSLDRATMLALKDILDSYNNLGCNCSGDDTNIPPNAYFIWTANELIVNFSDESFDTDGAIVSWNWDFGNGQTSIQQNPSHVYSYDGTYAVRLTVTDDDGDSDTVLENISVKKDTKEKEEIFYPYGDSYIIMLKPDTNRGSSNIMKVRNRYGNVVHPDYWEWDALIRFNLTPTLDDSYIKSATLNLFFYDYGDDCPFGRELTCHRLLDEWYEETVTWNNKPDYSEIVTSTSIVPNKIMEWMRWDVTQDVRDFISGGKTNHGWQIMDEVAFRDFNIPYMYFFTKENGFNIPYLKIEYEDITNHAPVIDFVYPIDGAENIATSGSPVNAGITDADNDLLWVEIWSNHTGSWTQYAGWDVGSDGDDNFLVDFNEDDVWDYLDVSNYVSSDGWLTDGVFGFYKNMSVTEDWNMTEPDNLYYWSINVTDNITWTNESFKFRTKEKYIVSNVYVDDDYNNNTPGWGVDHFNTVQDGINNVSHGGTIYVYKGIYYENPIVNKSVSIIGEDEVTTILDGGNVGDVVTIIVDDCTIENINIRNSGYYAGVKILSDRNIIKDSILYNNYYAIWLNASSNNTITNNIISNNKGGIRVRDSYDTTIVGNQLISNSLEDITLESSYSATITNNVLKKNGITITGTIVAWNSHNISGNTINNKPIYYYKNFNGISVPDDAGQVILANCNNFEVKNINFDNVIIGIQLGYCSDTILKDNDFGTNSQSSIFLYYSNYNTITDNTINGGNGIDLWESNNNNILNNVIEETSIAINVYKSDYNNIKSNIISDNYFAIWLYKYCSNNILNRNTISSNDNGGIWLMEGCSQNTISNNTISYNGHNSPQKANIYICLGCNNNVFFGNTIKSYEQTGIYIELDVIGDLNNLFYHNNFLTNSRSAYDRSTDCWDNGINVGGNYWDDYTGTDADGDGFGDTPYHILGGDNQDNYPYVTMAGWNSPPENPSNPSPSDNEIDVRIDVNLSWTCSDSEGDSIYYDIYLGTNNPPGIVENNYNSNLYDPVTLDYDTTYYWKIVARDKNGRTNAGEIWQFTTENRPPFVDFIWSPSSPLKYQEITFTDTSIDVGGEIVDWYWDFGDGTLSTERNPKHSYSKTGTFTVYLLITDDDNAVNYKSKLIHIETVPPSVDFSYSPTKPEIYESIGFTGLSFDSDGTIASRKWNFGDGTTSSIKNPLHTYSQPGTYKVTLSVADNDGGLNSKSKNINVISNIVENKKPTASFTFAPSEPEPLETIQFTSTSTDPDGYIAKYSWDFGDGTTSTEQNSNHSYQVIGTYTIKLSVTDDDGDSDSTSISIFVGNLEPIASFKALPATPNINTIISFIDKSFDPDGSIISWSWDFGDGETSTEQNPSHQYASSGGYTIALSVVDNEGATDTELFTLVVYPNNPPNADAGGPYSARPIALLTIDGSDSYDSDGSIVGYRWDFEDDGVYDTEWSTSSTVKSSFSIEGLFVIRLQVKDDDGDIDEDTAIVTISENTIPVAIVGGPYSGKVNHNIAFDGSSSYDSDGSIVGYRWDFEDDGFYDTEWLDVPTKNFNYPSIGIYTVKLQVKDNEGATNDTTTLVTIYANKNPVANAGESYFGIENYPGTLDASESYDPDGSIVGYRWDFEDDGVYDTGWLDIPTKDFNYASIGIYTLKLQVKDDDGATDTDTAVVVISENVPPVAMAGGSYSDRINKIIIFDGSGSYDNDGTIVNYRWDFDNDGTYDTSWLTSSSSSHKYAVSGIYKVKLQVKDNHGATDTDTEQVRIFANTKPTADAGGDYSGFVNFPITFDGSGSNDPDGKIIGYKWDFNSDGTYDTNWILTAPSYIYSKSGKYTLTLQVKDNDGDTDISTATVTINTNDAPVADAGGPYESWINIPIKFDASGSTDSNGVITGHRWDFNGDKIYDTNWILASPSYTYTSKGTYTVTVQVKDDLGATDTDTATVTILQNKDSIADAGGPYSSFIGENIIFNGSGSYDSDGVITAYRWDFKNDGLYDTNWLTVPTTEYSYAIGGIYTVKVQVKDDHGSTDTDTATVKIDDSHLRGLWHLDEGVGSIAYDSSDYENDGDIYGALWAGIGKFDDSLHFNGASDNVKVDDITLSFDYFTISVWAKFDDTTGTMPIISRQDGTGIGRNIITLQDNEIKSNIGGVKIGTGYSPDVYRWHHYVLTYGDGELKIYIDGALQATENVIEEDATGAYIFGADKELATFFDGMLDEIVIWSRVLSLYEIQNLYSVPCQPTFENPANRTKWVDPYIGRLSVIVSEPYEFEEPVLEEIDIDGKTYDRVEQEGSEGYGEPGEPRLPAKGAYILLPPGSDISDIKVITGEREYLGYGYHVDPVAMPSRLDSDEIIYLDPDDEIYNSDEMFPGKFYTIAGTYGFRGYQILVLTLHSVQYVPSTGELYYYKDMIVTVETSENDDSNELFRGFERDKLATEDLVDNPGMSGEYAGSSQGSQLSDNYDMVIITTNSLKDGFVPLKQKHDSDGLRTLIYTVEDIYSQYAGADNPEKIRNFIKYAYSNMGIEYVLLGGDTNVVPARKLWVQSWAGGYVDKMPSDVYFGCLDGSFNYDGDSNWGEPNDGENGGDVDLIAEVYVGRASVGSMQEVNYFVSKTLSYLNAENDEYLKEVLLVGEHLGFGGVAEYAANAMNELIDGSSSSGYTTVGIPSNEYNIDTLYDSEWANNNWPKSEIINRINNNVHVVNHLGHANYIYNMKLYTYDTESLTNDKFSFIYSQGCMAGGFDYSDCIAEYFTTKTEAGAFAGIWNARYGWGRGYSTDGPSQRFNREFWDAVFGEGLSTLGKANQDSKEDNLYRIGSSCMRWCYYELNLFGDPSIDLIKQEEESPDEPDDQIGDMDVSFYWGDDTLIGVDESVGNNSRASVEIGPLTRYTNVSWYVTIDDGFNLAVGPIWWFTVEAYDWDINRDGRADDLDSELLISRYGESSEPGWIREDIIRDGMINIRDISKFVEHYGEAYVIDFIKDEDRGTLTVKAVNLDDIKWSELKLIGNGNIQHSSDEVTVGDKIVGCDGIITLTYKPVDTVSWTWEFGDTSGSSDSSAPDSQDQSYDCDINNDGNIDDSDIVVISEQYGQTGEPGWISADINYDGYIDYSDVSILIGQYENAEEVEEEEQESNDNINNNPGGGGGGISTPAISTPVIQPSENISDEEFEEENVVENDITPENNIEINDDGEETIERSLRSVNINGESSSLVSVDGDTIPDYIKDKSKDTLTPVTHSPGRVTEIIKDNDEDKITVTIQVQKANWIYIEAVDQYPDLENLIVTTSDGRIISEDMIWRENGKIYVLDDPDVKYHFIYQDETSQGVASLNSATAESFVEIPWIYLAYIGLVMLLLIGLVLFYKKKKRLSRNLHKTRGAFNEIDDFIKDYKNENTVLSYNMAEKQYKLLKTVYSGFEDSEYIMLKLNITMPKLESMVDELVECGLMKYTSDDEVELTRKGIKYIKSKER